MSDISLSSNDLVPVLFICSSGHSGSTLLDLLLDSQDGVFGCGELGRLQRQRREERACACGRDLDTCPFWSRVGLTDVPLQCKRNTILFVSGWWGDDAQYVRRANEHLYQAIRTESGAQILVDSSKDLDRCELCAHAVMIQPIIIHLVRDGRGVMRSYRRKGSGTVRSIWRWLAPNIKCEITKRRIRAPTIFIRYEELVDQPHDVLSRILSEAGHKPNQITTSFADHTHHEVAGNHMRSTTRTIQPDRRWHTQLSRVERFIFAVLAGWLNWWYRRER